MVTYLRHANESDCKFSTRLFGQRSVNSFGNYSAMQISTFFYQHPHGWSAVLPAELDSPETMVLAFGGASLYDDSGSVTELAAVFPTSKLIGCSTSGEILGTDIRDDSLAVAVVRFENTPVRVAFSSSPTLDDSYTAGQEIAETLNAPNLRSVLLLSHGQHVNGTQLVNGVNSVLSKKVVVTGGLAGDGDRFERTWVIKDGKPTLGIVSGLGLYGPNVRIGHGSKGGWDIFGPERLVTRSEGSILYELDGKPALELYKLYLGERASELPASAMLFPLALRADSTTEKRVVRTVLAVDEVSQSLTFAGDIQQGSLAQLMKANLDRLIDGASRAALMASEVSEHQSQQLAIAISCVGRRLVLGERTEEELETTCEILPEGTEQIGFYSYGEISPYASGHCDLHNQTMTLTTISEA